LRRNPGHLIDLAPTILELAGGQWPTAWGDVKVPTPPGKSLVPVFTRDRTVSHDYFWWFHEGHRAVREGDWKAVSLGGASPWELYDLANDRSEMNDLSAQHPERTSELAALWKQKMEEFKELASRDVPASGKNRSGGKAVGEAKAEAD
jgi:arylsulfatase